MKFVFLFGGACGLATGGAASYLAGHALDRTLLDASVGCLAGAMLFRGFWNAVLRGIREAYLARRAAALEPVVPAVPAAKTQS